MAYRNEAGRDALPWGKVDPTQPLSEGLRHSCYAGQVVFHTEHVPGHLLDGDLALGSSLFAHRY